jgi:hypothetical protein
LIGRPKNTKILRLKRSKSGKPKNIRIGEWKYLQLEVDPAIPTGLFPEPLGGFQ